MTRALFWIPSAMCVGGAIYLAANHGEGWGWFLFVALLLGGAARRAGD